MPSTQWAASVTREALTLLEAYLAIDDLQAPANIAPQCSCSVSETTTQSIDERLENVRLGNLPNLDNQLSESSSPAHGCWDPSLQVAERNGSKPNSPFCPVNTNLKSRLDGIRHSRSLFIPSANEVDCKSALPIIDEVQLQHFRTSPNETDVERQQLSGLDQVDVLPDSCRRDQSTFSTCSSVEPQSSHGTSDQMLSRTSSRLQSQSLLRGNVNSLPRCQSMGRNQRNTGSSYGGDQMESPSVAARGSYDRAVSVQSAPNETEHHAMILNSTCNGKNKRKRFEFSKLKRFIFGKKSRLKSMESAQNLNIPPDAPDNRFIGDLKSSKESHVNFFTLLLRRWRPDISPTVPHFSGGLFVRKPIRLGFHLKSRRSANNRCQTPESSDLNGNDQLVDNEDTHNKTAPNPNSDEMTRIYKELIQKAEGTRLKTSAIEVWRVIEASQGDVAVDSLQTCDRHDIPIRPNTLHLPHPHTTNLCRGKQEFGLLHYKSEFNETSDTSNDSPYLTDTLPHSIRPMNGSQLPSSNNSSTLPTNTTRKSGVNCAGDDQVPYVIVAQMINALSQRIMNQISDEELESRLRMWEAKADAYKRVSELSSPLGKQLHSNILKHSLLAQAKRLENRHKIELCTEFLDCLIARVDYAYFEADLLKILTRRPSWRQISILYYLSRCAVRHLMQTHFVHLESLRAEYTTAASDNTFNAESTSNREDVWEQSLRATALDEMGHCRASAKRIKDFTVTFFLRWYADWVYERGGWKSVIEETDDSEID